MVVNPRASIVTQWIKDSKFLSLDAYGHRVVTDAPKNSGDPFDGFMPNQLLLASLASCTGIDVIQILQKQRQKVSALQIEIEGIQKKDPPWPYQEIHLTFRLRGRQLNPTMVERAILLSETKYCSVGATITGVSRISTSYSIEED